MDRVPIAELKDRTSEFVARAERGEHLVITRHGKEAARLMPPSRLDPENARALIERTTRNRDAIRADTGPIPAGEIRRWIEEGRD